MRKVMLDVKGKNKGHYAPGMISGNNLYISGQLSIDLDTREVPNGGVEKHMELALHNVERVLTAAVLERKDVVQCRVYITDVEHWDAINEVYAKFFGEHTPARIVVPVPALHFGCLVEIEAVAEMNEETGYQK